jgi:hypothetical protein
MQNKKNLEDCTLEELGEMLPAFLPFCRPNDAEDYLLHIWKIFDAENNLDYWEISYTYFDDTLYRVTALTEKEARIKMLKFLGQAGLLNEKQK